MRKKPAAGVMQTKPVIMPWTAPMTEGFRKKMTSRMTQVSKLVAVQAWVLRTAREASAFTMYGSPPLNPVHPIHNSPAPASIRRMLFGGNLSLSLFSLGPTCQIIHMHALKSIHIYSQFQWSYMHISIPIRKIDCQKYYTWTIVKGISKHIWFSPKMQLWNQQPRKTNGWHIHLSNLLSPFWTKSH